MKYKNFSFGIWIPLGFFSSLNNPVFKILFKWNYALLLYQKVLLILFLHKIG